MAGAHIQDFSHSIYTQICRFALTQMGEGTLPFFAVPVQG